MSSSYSALLRRSKLASFNPAIEQVYSTSGGNLSRSNFGLKRPLPQATTQAAPLVRLNKLDNAQKRTEFRKGTKEALFVKKWAEQGHQITSTADAELKPAEYHTAVQSRFVPAAFGRGVPAPTAALEEARALAGRAPNFIEMSEAQFEAWLDALTARRDEFAAFVQQRSGASEAVSLYEVAQGEGATLVRSLEAFLALTSPNPLLSASLIAYPHRTLGLQYNTITPLESSFSPAVPGRMLGPRQSNFSDRRAGNLASVMGQLAFLTPGTSAGAATTSWFPDAEGVRSNAPGRATFKVKAVVHPSAFATRAALAAARGLKPFQPRTPPGTEASALAERVVSLALEVVSPGEQAARLPGSREYSGELPPSRKKYATFDTTDLLNFSGRAGKGEPRQLTLRPPFQTSQKRKQATARLTALRRKEGKLLAGGAEGDQAKKDSILESLNDLLDIGGKK